LTNNWGNTVANFTLDRPDRPERGHYRASLLGLLPERNVGRVRLERQPGAKRDYVFNIQIASRPQSLASDLRVNLDDKFVLWEGVDPHRGVTTVTDHRETEKDVAVRAPLGSRVLPLRRAVSTSAETRP
jgi:hypothetical protein